jgi:hypothetical protein
MIKEFYKEGIGVFENVASSEYCQKMIDKFEQISELSPSAIHHNEIDYNGADNRRDQAIFFEQHFRDMCEETYQYLNQALSLYVKEYPGLKKLNICATHVKVQKTLPKGGYHVWHNEQASDIESIGRVLVWTLYLNDIPEGQGETEFLYQGFRLHPKMGTVCFFPACWTHYHRGNLMVDSTKYIATGWYYLTN